MIDVFIGTWNMGEGLFYLFLSQKKKINENKIK